MANHAVRMDSPGLEQLHQGALDHENDRLGQLDFIEFLLAGRKTGMAERSVRVLSPVFLNRIDHAAENRVGVVKRAAATGPLRALPGEHQGHPPLALIHRGHRRWAFDEDVKRLGQFLPAAHRKGRTRGEVGSAAAEIAGQRVQIHFRLAQGLAQLLRTARQQTGGARRQGNHVAGFRRQRNRPEPRLRRAVFPHHAVPVGAAKAERIDADQDRRFGKRLARRLHLHGAVLEIDLGVRHQVIFRNRRERAPLHHQHDLEQSAMESGGFHVPYIALDTGNSQRHLPVETAERLVDGGPLNAVAHHGTGGMGFNVVEFSRFVAGTSARQAHQVRLRVTGRGGDVTPLSQAAAAVGSPGRIDCRCLHDGVYRVPVSLGRFQGLDRKDERPFRAHVAVGFRVEGVALAVWADDPQGVEGSAKPGCPHVIYGGDDGLLAIAALECVHRGVQCGEAGGTSRAIGG